MKMGPLGLQLGLHHLLSLSGPIQPLNKVQDYNIPELSILIKEFNECSIVIHIPFADRQHFDLSLSQITVPIKLTSASYEYYVYHINQAMTHPDLLYTVWREQLLLRYSKEVCVTKFVLAPDLATLSKENNGNGLGFPTLLFQFDYNHYQPPDDKALNTLVILSTDREEMLKVLAIYNIFVYVREARFEGRTFILNSHVAPSGDGNQSENVSPTRPIELEVNGIDLYYPLAEYYSTDTVHVHCHYDTTQTIPCRKYRKYMEDSYRNTTFNGTRAHVEAGMFARPISGSSWITHLPDPGSPFRQARCYLDKYVSLSPEYKSPKACSFSLLVRLAFESAIITTIDSRIATHDSQAIVLQLNELGRRMMYLRSDVAPIAPLFSRNPAAMIDTIHFNFATCDGVQQRISYEFYWKPYDLESWSSICLAVLLLPLATMLLVTVASRCLPTTTIKTWRKLWIDLVSAYLTILFEVSPSLPPEIRSQPLLNKIVNYAIGGWILMTVVLSNAYKGVFVSELTAPIPWKGSWESTKDMMDFVFVGTTNQNLEGERKYEYWRSRNANVSIFMVDDLCHCIHRTRYLNWFPHVVDKWPWADTCNDIEGKLEGFDVDRFIPDFKNVDPNRCPESKVSNVPAMILIEPATNNFQLEDAYTPTSSPSMKWSNGTWMDKPQQIPADIPFQKSLLIIQNDLSYDNVYELTSNCDKTAYIHEEEYIDAFLAHVKITGKSTTFIKGKHPIFPVQYGFQFLDRRQYDTVQLLLSSGILWLYEEYQMLKYPTYHQQLIRNMTKLQLVLQRLPKRLNLDSNVRSAFQIYGMLLCTATAVLLIEWAYKNCRVKNCQDCFQAYKYGAVLSME